MLASRETIFIGSLVTANKFALHASHHSMSCTSLSDWRISVRTSLRSGTGSDVVLEMVAVLLYVGDEAADEGRRANDGAALPSVPCRHRRVLRRHQLRQVHHHLALFPGGVGLHLAVDHDA